MYNLLRFTLFFPYFAFVLCLVLTIFKDMKKSTRTHCKVPNVLPSISAVIAGFEPQRFIWRLSFALNSTPRYLIAYLQLQRLLNRHHVASRELYRLAQVINHAIHFLELTFLLLLTYVSSNEVKRTHEYAFVGFILCSLMHMLATTLIDYYWPCTAGVDFTEREKHLRQKRLKWFVYNALCFFLAVVFFLRHMSFCEPYVYSFFSFFEYFVILTNIGYHSTIREEWDQEAGQIQFFY
jgi:hypothetical protein